MTRVGKAQSKSCGAKPAAFTASHRKTAADRSPWCEWHLRRPAGFLG